jgi:hypothetical protein
VNRSAGFAFLTGAIGLVGCIPVRTLITPAVSGQIYSEGAPAQEVGVHLIPWFQSKQCGASSTHSITSSEGTFTFAPIRKTDWILPVGPTDRLFDWAVCINYRGKWVLGYSERDFAYLRRKSIHLTCDLSAPPGSDTGHEAQHGICRADDV